jgi:two-component system cell cycle response regulator
VLLSVLREHEPMLNARLGGVARLAATMGRTLAMDAEDLDVLVRAAEMHDIGKVAIPDEVLYKAGELSDDEWALMRTHPVIGERVLAAAPSLREVAKAVRSTHEHWDGSGYPDGLAGDAIPRNSRMILICDAYHAMTSGRSYEEAISEAAAIAELRRGEGKQFDPELVEVFVTQAIPELADAAQLDDLSLDDSPREA